MKFIYPLFLGVCLFFVSNPCEGQLLPKNSNVVVTNEGRINSGELEYSPAFYQDGLVFITTKHPGEKYKVIDTKIDKNTMNIYYSARDTNGLLSEPVPFAQELLTIYHEGPLTFNRTGDFLYFTRNDYVRGRRGRANKDGETKLKIFSAERVGDQWTNVQELSFNSKEYNTCHPSISVDGQLLYFSSNREGGYGGMDLYVAKRVGDDWGEPVNLGPNINTGGNEIFPYIHADNTLYFSTNGRETMGGLDLFYCTQEVTEEWSSPKTLGKPFNSEFDDFGLIVDRDKKNGYFSSNRLDGKGGDDIYNFYASGRDGLDENSQKMRDMMIVVSDKQTGAFIEAAKIVPLNIDELSITDVVTDANGNVIKLKSVQGEGDELLLKLDVDEDNIGGLTDLNGEYQTQITNQNYVVKVSKDGYQSREVVVEPNEEMDVVYVMLDKASSCVALSGLAKDYNSGSPVLGVNVSIKNDETGETNSVTSGNSGQFDYCLPCGYNYTITGSKSGYGPSVGTISTKNVECIAGSTLAYDVNMLRGGYASGDPGTGGAGGSGGYPPYLSEGAVIELSNIYYNFNDAKIRPDARVDLDALANIMQTFPDMTIELRSHTDSRGRTSYNSNLSQRRAENVVSYLAGKGISRSRMEPRGYGESELRNGCSDGVSCSETEHQYNRRTEFRVVSISPNVSVQYINNPPSVTDNSYLNRSRRSSRSSSSSSGSSSSGSNYIVIAGSFKSDDNAAKRLNEVQALGFANARIQNYGNIKAVVVSEFGSRSEASSLESELEGTHGVNAYVKVQR